MSLLRTLAEKLSRNRVIRRRLPADLGRRALFVSPDASLTFWKPGLRSDLFDFAREFVRPGDTVWDIGANVGLFTFSAAHCAGPSGRVVALEPDLWLAGLLRRTAYDQNALAAKVEIISAAASSEIGICDFNIAMRGRASNFLGIAPGGGQSGGIRQTVQTMTITLDWLLDQRPAPKVIKIDVEGAEISVLKGATRLLKEVRPVLLCEISEPSVEPAREIFRANGYLLFDWHNRTAGPLDQPTWDTLAVPSEMAEKGGSLHLQPSARPRRVLFVMHRLNISGVSHHTLLLAKGLRRLGWEIAVAARDLAPGTPMGQEAMEAEGLRVFQVPFPGYGLNLRNISAAMRTMFALNRVVKTFGADVLHVHAPTLTPYVGLAGWRNRIQTVSTLHVETLGRNKVWLGQIGNRLFSRMFGDYSVAISTDMARLLVNCLGVPPTRVRTILHGVDDQRFRPPSPQERLDARAAYGLSDDARVVCMIAVLEERKNHAMLARMLAELRHRGMDVIALCAGAGEEDDRQRIEKLAAEAGVADLVRLIGYRDSRQVMWASDASLLLSTQEGFGLVTIESMLCGLVPLRTPAAGAADQIADETNGFIVPFGDHRFLADRLQTLFTQPELRKKMGEAAREFALAHFSADRMAQETAQVYLDAIARRSPERESERP